MKKKQAERLAHEHASQLKSITGEDYSVEVVDELESVWVCRMKGNVVTGDVVKRFDFER